MSFITESKLKSYRPSYGSYTKTNSRVLLEFKNESKYFKTKIFLSHKHDEVEQLEGAISFLKKHGVEVYVDWLDEGMPKTTSGITAARIKEKIKENDKFILLDRKSTRLNSSHVRISYAVFCLKKKKKK